jgi:glyoxylase-like metal-dependent hydrolase (beta-lactamase superfamily II)
MSGFEIHQLFPGREICRYSIFTPIQSIIFENIAKPLGNFIYLIADKESRDCIVIDACWDIYGILKYAKDKNLRIVGAVITHYHVDHIGGIPPPPYDKYRVKVDGILKLKRLVNNLKVYAHELEIDNIIKGNPGLKAQDIIPTRTGTTFHIPSTKSELSLLQGGVRFEFYHTPGHTPGSQCLLVNGNRLFSGDTLFISSCGRVDFPDSCKNSMFDSLQNTLSTLDDDVS